MEWNWFPVFATKAHLLPVIVNCYNSPPPIQICLFPCYSLGFKWEKEIQCYFYPISYSYPPPYHALYYQGRPSSPTGRNIEGIYNPIVNCKVFQWWEKRMCPKWTWAWESGYGLCLLIFQVLYPFNPILMIGSWFPLEKDPLPSLRVSKGHRPGQ